MMNFLIDNKEIVALISGAIIGSLFTKAKAHFIGRKVGNHIPKNLATIIADRIDAFEKGLRNEEYNGDQNLVSNEQLSRQTEKLKIDLGLDQHLKENGLK